MRYEEVYKIGKIGKPHGIKGEVTLFFSDDVFDRTDSDYVVLCIDGILVPFFMEEYRFHGSETALVKFCDIDSQEAARELTGCDVYFPRSLADEAGGDMSLAQIVGYTIVDVQGGSHVGTIESVDDSTANMLFAVATPDGRELLLPAHAELVEYVDTERQEVGMHLPEGITDL